MHHVDEMDLKRDFEQVLPLIDRGESVMITRDGKDFMRPDPASSSAPRGGATVSNAR